MEWWRQPDWWIAGLTAAIAALTFGLVRKTHNLVVEARESSSRQLRAYLNVFECFAEWEDDGELLVRQVRITIEFRNTGQTPANKVRCWANAASVVSGFERFDGPAGDPRESKGVSAPGQTGRMIFKTQFTSQTEDEVAVWRAGERTLVVYGKLIYFDAFDVERTTHFRYYMPPEGVGASHGSFMSSADGNDAT